MLFANPVRGTIKPDAKSYPGHPLAVRRPPGSHIPLVTLDFGPTAELREPAVDWPGGESDIFGRAIAAIHHDHFHKGIDISRGACTGDVLAAAHGKVRVSHVDGSGAQVIVIEHPAVAGHVFRTRYAHLSERLKVVGDVVEPGMLIGQLGGTGALSTACHLHFAVERDGAPVDPWRRLAQNSSVDPDVPAVTAPTIPAEVPDVPIPASNEEYLAGQVALVGNPTIGAQVRVAPKLLATLVRTVPGGIQETWLPTCWVVGDTAFETNRWLTRWHEGQWEFTHAVNVESVTPL